MLFQYFVILSRLHKLNKSYFDNDNLHYKLKMVYVKWNLCIHLWNIYMHTHQYYTCVRKDGNVLFNDTLNTFTVIWCHTYGKGPLR